MLWGVIWSLNQNPTKVSSRKTSSNAGAGIFVQEKNPQKVTVDLKACVPHGG